MDKLPTLPDPTEDSQDSPSPTESFQVNADFLPLHIPDTINTTDLGTLVPEIPVKASRPSRARKSPQRLTINEPFLKPTQKPRKKKSVTASAQSQDSFKVPATPAPKRGKGRPVSAPIPFMRKVDPPLSNLVAVPIPVSTATQLLNSTNLFSYSKGSSVVLSNPIAGTFGTAIKKSCQIKSG